MVNDKREKSEKELILSVSKYVLSVYPMHGPGLFSGITHEPQGSCFNKTHKK